jgi:peptide/nickel transport system permease protein
MQPTTALDPEIIPPDSGVAIEPVVARRGLRRHRAHAAGATALRFLAMLALTFLGLLAVTFVIGRVVPIDPVLAVVGDRAPPDVYAAARAAMGLDEPLWRQFVIYVSDVFHADLGTSTLTSRPVAEDIAAFFPATLELATLAIAIGIGLGLPAGIVSAVWAHRWPDHFVRLLGLVGYSAPVFWLGLMGLLLFYAELGWVAGPGRLDIYYEGLVPTVTGLILIDAALAGEWEVFRNAFQHVILPAAILGWYSMAYLSRMTRSFVMAELKQEYVTTARVKGVPERRIILRHVLGNAAIPLVTVIALSYGSLLEGAVLTETVFAWPGLGRYITDSLFNADMDAVLGGTIVVGTVFIALNLLSDLLYRVLDPRVRR